MKVMIAQSENFLSKDKTVTDFISGTIAEVCKTQAGQVFTGVWFAGKPILQESEGIRNIILKPPAFATLWKQTWLARQLAGIIKSEQPDCIMSIDGSSIKTSIPQCVLITGLNNSLVKKPDLQVHAVTFSEYLKQVLIEKGYQSEKISVISPVASNLFVPLEWDIREAIKKKYAQQAEYFFLDASGTSPRRMLNVLKAFSIFKKWQKSTARLFIYITGDAAAEEWMKLLPSYKFREEVIVHHFINAEERALITASAMCMLYFPDIDATGIDLLGSIQARIPVITHNSGAVYETIGDAALYCNADDVDDIAERMKKIYRDEKLRSQVMYKLITRAEGLPQNNAAQHLWEIIEQVATGKHTQTED